jgi:hydrogenase nickel incorporation protein HypA/HybF
MHELGLVFEVINRVEALAKENGIQHIQKVVLAIGEISYVVPMFIEEVYAPACRGTVLEGSELVMETIPARGKCRRCRRAFIWRLVCRSQGPWRRLPLFSGIRLAFLPSLRMMVSSTTSSGRHFV